MQENHEEIYKRIKKRLADYRYRSGFFTLGTMVFAVLLILSLFPLVPILIAGYFGLAYSDFAILLWFLCIGIFAVMFWIFQKVARSMEEKRGITLEERMYVHAYEALCHFREYFDPNHPIKSGKLKAERRVLSILTLLDGIRFPNTALIREEAVQLWQLRRNLRMKLLPSIKRFLNVNDPNMTGNLHSLLIALVDYLSKPELLGLAALNKSMISLSEITERSIYDIFRSTLFKRSNMRHVMAFSIATAVALLISYVDLNYLGASPHDAFILWVGSTIALATLYVTYLGLTVRREQRT